MEEELTCGSIIEDIKNEGRAEGRIEGIEEGRAEGRIEGRAEGRIEGSLAVLNKLAIDSDYCVDELAEMFGFTKEQIINRK